MRPFQESDHDVSVGADAGRAAGEQPPDPLLAQLGLQRSAGEATLLIPGGWSLSVSGDRVKLSFKCFFFISNSLFI